LESERAGGQMDHPEDQESTDCDIDADTRADVGGETAKDKKELVRSTPPVKARRDAFI
jgi:hypothetical protein